MSVDFSSPRVWQMLEGDAYNGTCDCTGFPPAEYRYFTELVRLYAAYRQMVITKETAGQRKAMLLKDYRDAIHVFEQAQEAYRDWQDNIRKIGSLRTLIAREPDERERLRLCIQAIAVMTGDQVFRMTELERLERKDNHED